MYSVTFLNHVFYGLELSRKYISCILVGVVNIICFQARSRNVIIWIFTGKEEYGCQFASTLSALGVIVYLKLSKYFFPEYILLTHEPFIELILFQNGFPIYPTCFPG